MDDTSMENSVVNVLGKVLMKLIEANESRMAQAPAPSVVTKFQSSCVPEVTVEAYLQRIRKYAKCSDSCFVIALIYIDRIIEMRNFALSRLNIHRLLIAAMQVSAKYLDDLYYNNAFYAKLGGVTTAEMNVLEMEFLMLIGFSLHVKAEIFEAYSAELACYGKSAATPVSPSTVLPQVSGNEKALSSDCETKTGLNASENAAPNRLVGLGAKSDDVCGSQQPASPNGVDYLQPSPLYYPNAVVTPSGYIHVSAVATGEVTTSASRKRYVDEAGVHTNEVSWRPQSCSHPATSRQLQHQRERLSGSFSPASAHPTNLVRPVLTGDYGYDSACMQQHLLIQKHAASGVSFHSQPQGYAPMLSQSAPAFGAVTINHPAMMMWNASSTNAPPMGSGGPNGIAMHPLVFAPHVMRTVTPPSPAEYMAEIGGWPVMKPPSHFGGNTACYNRNLTEFGPCMQAPPGYYPGMMFSASM